MAFTAATQARTTMAQGHMPRLLMVAVMARVRSSDADER
jgi:hypothetical protein